MGLEAWIAFGVVAVVVVWAIATYNRLVALRNRFRNAFAQIDVQLKRRHDLIPNLVETVKGYMAHERQTLEAVMTARAAAQQAGRMAAATPGDPAAMRALASAEAGLSGALGRLFALAEAYPELKANQSLLPLQEELTSTENRVAFARQGYNDSVMEYNVARESFPGRLAASPFGFPAAELLAATESADERKAPRVSFS